jgi:hypothetical protein
MERHYILMLWIQNWVDSRMGTKKHSTELVQQKNGYPNTKVFHICDSNNVVVLFWALWYDGGWLQKSVTLIVKRNRNLVTSNRKNIVIIFEF